MIHVAQRRFFILVEGIAFREVARRVHSQVNAMDWMDQYWIGPIRKRWDEAHWSTTHWAKVVMGSACGIGVLASLISLACSSGLRSSPSSFMARADIQPTSSASAVNGTATFTEEDGEVTVVVNVRNAFPSGSAGLRGLHIHEEGKCGATKSDNGAVTPAGAAGGHWNPTRAPHGYPDQAAHHLGDLGNIEIKPDGTGTLIFKTREFHVREGANSVLGRAIVFHQLADDGVSQPLGNAGVRAGCGVIIRDY